MTESDGTWGDPKQISPDVVTERPNVLRALACPSTTMCVAGGRQGPSAIVADALDGDWAETAALPGMMVASAGGSEITDVSCASADFCVAVGDFREAAGTPLLLVDSSFVSELVTGRWNAPSSIPGMFLLNRGIASATSVDCPTEDFCTVVGAISLSTLSDPKAAFYAQRVNGIWGEVQVIPGTEQFDLTQPSTTAEVVDCPSVGNCVIVGNYGSVEGASDPFIWEQVDGQWQEPQLVRSLGDGTELGADATLKALSCGSAGNCVAGGELTPAGGPMPFFLLQRNGQWGDAQALPGFPEATSLSTYDGPKPYATVDRIVCSSGLNCIATGTFADTPIPSVFVSALIDGRWQKAEVVEPLGVPGDLAGQHLINGADCTNEGQCTVVGTSLGTAFWMRINLGS
jgi:hypothetical protein